MHSNRFIMLSHVKTSYIPLQAISACTHKKWLISKSCNFRHPLQNWGHVDKPMQQVKLKAKNWTVQRHHLMGDSQVIPTHEWHTHKKHWESNESLNMVWGSTNPKDCTISNYLFFPNTFLTKAGVSTTNSVLKYGCRTAKRLATKLDQHRLQLDYACQSNHFWCWCSCSCLEFLEN